MNPFYSLFGNSPIKPIQQHMHVVQDCSEQLLPFVKLVYTQDWNKAQEIHKNIVTLEETADKLKKDIRLKLPSGLFLPVPRSDLLNMLRTQDKIANKTKDIAGIIFGRKTLFPSPISDTYLS